MSIKIVVATVVILGFATGQAFAESDSNPFPFAAAPQVTSGRAFVVVTGSEQYPVATGNAVQASTLAQLEPVNGQDRIVHTAGSLPRGSDDGDAVTAHARKSGTIEAGVGRPAS